MANLILTDFGIEDQLGFIRAGWNAKPTMLHLFQNNHTPLHGDTVSAYTEATFPGYAPMAINDWSVVSVTLSVAKSQAATKVFICTGGTPNNIYGYYVTDASGASLYFAQKDDLAPVPIGSLGDVYAVVPIITHISQF